MNFVHSKANFRFLIFTRNLNGIITLIRRKRESLDNLEIEDLNDMLIFYFSLEIDAYVQEINFFSTLLPF